MRIPAAMNLLATLLVAAVPLSPVRASAQTYRYDALGRLQHSCMALIADGERADYMFDAADNRANYTGIRTDISLLPQSGVTSPDGNFMLWMQSDGNLVLYQKSGSSWVPTGWATNTVGSGAAVADFQSDGNLVLYTSLGTPVWASNSAPNYCATLAVQNDGNIVISSVDGTPIWASNTGGH